MTSLLRRVLGPAVTGAPPQAAGAERIGMRVGEMLLYTLEERRNQITQKATVSAAAASGVIVLGLQFVLAQEDAMRATRVIGLAAVLAAAVSLIQALNIIRALGRRRVHDRSRSHLLYFGTVTRLGPAGTAAELASIDEEGYLQQLAAQAASLSQNLRQRYTSLARSYGSASVAIVLLCFAIGLQQFERLDDSTFDGVEESDVKCMSRTMESPPVCPSTSGSDVWREAIMACSLGEN